MTDLVQALVDSSDSLDVHLPRRWAQLNDEKDVCVTLNCFLKAMEIRAEEGMENRV